MDFVDLHLHSTFSFLDGYGRVSQVVERAKALGRKAVAITDHGNVSAFVDLHKCASSAEIKPIYGCEFYLVPKLTENTRSKYHITVLAKDNTGYKNLLDLVTKAWENFYYKPTIDIQSLLLSQKGLIVLSGCYTSIFRGLIESDESKAVSLLKLFREHIEHFYAEFQPFRVCKDYNSRLSKIVDELGIPKVATCDVHYVERNQHYVHKLLHCVHFRKDWDSVEYPMDPIMYQRTPEEILENFKSLNPDIEWEKALNATNEIADMCNVEISRNMNIQFPYEGDKFQRLVSLCRSGMEEKGFSGNETYEARLSLELELIKKKEFVDYFLIVHDICSWAKSNGVLVGPGRGSSAGSLVCYLLTITQVDPLEYDLLFERFIDINRTDLPDIDMDFDEAGRDLVIEHLKQMYGEDNFAQLAIYAEFKGRNSLDEAGKAFGVPEKHVSLIKGLLLTRSEADARVSFTIEDTLNKFPKAKAVVEAYPKIMSAKYLEGQLRHIGCSAAGYLIDKSLREKCAVYKGKDGRFLSFDKHGVEYLGMMKMDLLNLKTLSVLKDIIARIGMKPEDLVNIPMDDRATLEGFATRDTCGIFQFEGDSVNSIIAQVRVDKFVDIVDINSLGRPGPIHSRASRKYVMVRGGFENRTSLNPIYDGVTSDTYGEVLYQEQVMKIMKNVGNLSWEEVSYLRRAMSKSTGVEAFAPYKKKFIQGASENGISSKMADDIWNRTYHFASWAFNKSHAVAYSMLGFWMMYMKVHHPLEFYWSSVLHEKEEESRNRILFEAKNRGIKLLPPDVNKSQIGWSIEDGCLRAGLGIVKGIGPKAIEEVFAKRPFTDLSDLKDRCIKRVVNSRVVGLIESKGLVGGAFEFDIFEKWTKLDSISGRDKISEVLFPAESRKALIAGYCTARDLYNLKEEDQIKGIHKTYKDEDKLDIVILNVKDDTGTIKVRTDRYQYHDMKDQIWDLKETDLVVFEGTVKRGQRTMDMKTMRIVS